jgi:ATP-dependent helicase/DNAse subunit B
VFNEIELVLDGKRLRLDRLMIDSKLKAVMIVDYKSGDETDPGQLDTYKRALEQLPALQAEAYKIETRNVSLK